MAGYEAQKLISISLGKIAASRVGRAGTSLHKSLLVATVLHKARHVFMEESYSIYYQQQQPRVGVLPSPSQVVVNPSASYHQEQHHYAHQGEYCEYYPPQPSCSTPSTSPSPQGPQMQQESKSQGSCTTYTTTTSTSSPASTTTTTTTTTSSSEPIYQDVTDDEDDDKENQTDCVPTYLDLDSCSSRTRAASTTTPLGDASNTVASRKRRRPISDQETQEAVSSILPKKSKKETARSDVELRALPPPTPCYRSDDDDGGEADTECGPDDDDDEEEDSDTESNAMEVEHITSLVSIFSFGGMGASGGSGSTVGRVAGAPVVRTVSSPDLCSTQAIKDPLDVVQRPVLALTV